jgi:2-dehydropantoate 2-reductase
MKIAVMGAGGIGGCFGGLLAKAGLDVTLIARGKHLKAIQKNGLQVNQPESSYTVEVKATDDPSQIGPVDVVLLSVKTYQNQQAIPLMKPLIGSDSAVITLQNGVESADEVGQEYGPERVLPGTAYLLCNVESPGVVRQRAPIARMAFGETSGELSPRAIKIQDTFSEAGIEADLSEYVMKALWSKLLYNTPANGLACASRITPRAFFESPEGYKLFQSAFQEVADVATASGVSLGDVDVKGAMKLVAQRPMDGKGSMQADLEAGRPLELEAIVGSVGRIGRRFNVETPLLDLVYALLLPHKDGHPEGA